MSAFVERLLTASREANSLVCIGLDVNPAAMPSSVLQQLDPIVKFNKAIIDATADLVCAYKPNFAFYEALGSAGWDALVETVKYIPKGKISIADAKRGDIGNTSAAYAKAIFEICGFDAVTVSPYLGQDALQPFLDYQDRGVIVLCKTSNPGSNEFQNLSVIVEEQGKKIERPMYQEVARRVSEWNANQNCGLVVGATYPAELAAVRAIAPDLPILMPGVGAQAGDLETAVKNGVNRHGELLMINSSRAIIYASSGDDFAIAARRATIALRDAINDIRKQLKV
jgi:orotidine-5'-phosphate decarboxylase